MRRQIQTLSAAELLTGMDAFDTLIDARSESEYALDHIPGAVNHPVLNDRQRITIGTLYKQVDSFTARKHGAQFANLNIARHLTGWMDHDRDWRPVVYCWRGGQRSGSLALVLHEIGWPVRVLSGGYKAYRRYLQERLPEAIAQLEFRLLTGPTGSGKTQLLQAMADDGFQTIDLEGLAQHRGSLLGGFATEQPTQKWFESRLFAALAGMDPARPVWLESESSKIGQLHLPEALFQKMLLAPALAVTASSEARAQFLIAGYDDMLMDPERLHTAIAALQFRQPRETIAQWHQWVDQQHWTRLCNSLLDAHYDPAYRRSQSRLYVCDSMTIEPGLLTADLRHHLEGLERCEYTPTQTPASPSDTALLGADS